MFPSWLPCKNIFFHECDGSAALTHRVESAVENGDAERAAGDADVAHVLPKVAFRVVSLHRVQLRVPVVSAYNVYVLTQTGYPGARATALHSRHHRPLVVLGMVTLHRAESLLAVEAADRVQQSVGRDSHVVSFVPSVCNLALSFNTGTTVAVVLTVTSVSDVSNSLWILVRSLLGLPDLSSTRVSQRGV